MGKAACEVGRDGKGMEVCEYCESLSLPACDIDMGRGAVDLLCWGEVVIMGGRGGWLGFEVGEETTGGDVAGEDVADMTVVIFGRGVKSNSGERSEAEARAREHVLSWAMSQRQARPTTAMMDCVPAPTIGSGVGSRPGAVRCGAVRYGTVPIAGVQSEYKWKDCRGARRCRWWYGRKAGSRGQRRQQNGDRICVARSWFDPSFCGDLENGFDSDQQGGSGIGFKDKREGLPGCNHLLLVRCPRACMHLGPSAALCALALVVNLAAHRVRAGDVFAARSSWRRWRVFGLVLLDDQCLRPSPLLFMRRRRRGRSRWGLV